MAQFRSAKLLAALSFALLAVPVSADTFSITLNTSATGFDLQGQAGQLVFQLSQGINSEPLTVTISDFDQTSGSLHTLDSTTTTPGVTGVLPSAVSIPNSLGQSVFYAQNATFGSLITFDANFVFTPTPGLNPSTAFDVDLAIPNFTRPSEFINAAAIDYDSDGNIGTSGDVTIGTTPEPASIFLVAFALLAAILVRRRFPHALTRTSNPGSEQGA